jgi:ArsR family transcriptional regulator, arsenate/arsenite/antimonite-responsive transcriptional repressor
MILHFVTWRNGRAIMLLELEAALKAAGDPTRTRVLKLLEAGPLCVCQVQAVLGLAPSTVSKHLTLLRTAGLVTDRRDGRWIHYALATEERNPYARAVLALLRGPLDREPRILEDRRRLRRVKAIPVETLCALPPSRRVPPGLVQIERPRPGRRPRRASPTRAPSRRRGPAHA